jgi:uncharacterized membrane protein YeaQ/YmgE (transglycosylase-associated protein family)
MPSIDQFIVWVIVGLLGGSLAGLVITRDRKGLGLIRNLGLGLVGALVGGLLFRVLGLAPGLDRVAISLRDVVAAFGIADRPRGALDVAALSKLSIEALARTVAVYGHALIPLSLWRLILASRKGGRVV